MRKPRLLSLLLAVALVVGLLPTAALAAEEAPPTCPYNLTVLDVPVTAENAADVLGDGTVSFDADGNTLTLNNANLGSADWDKTVISFPGDQSFTFHLVGKNTITAKALPGDYVFVIEATASGTDPVVHTISGTGSLDFPSATILADTETLVIDGVSITAKCEDGIWSRDAITLQNGANVQIDATRADSNALFTNTGDITITGGSTVTVSSDSDAIYTGENLMIEDGSSVTADGSGAAALYAVGDLSVTDSSLTLESFYGLYSLNGTIRLTNSTVTGEGCKWTVTCPQDALVLDGTSLTGLVQIGTTNVFYSDGQPFAEGHPLSGGLDLSTPPDQPTFYQASHDGIFTWAPVVEADVVTAGTLTLHRANHGVGGAPAVILSVPTTLVVKGESYLWSNGISRTDEGALVTSSALTITADAGSSLEITSSASEILADQAAPVTVTGGVGLTVSATQHGIRTAGTLTLENTGATSIHGDHSDVSVGDLVGTVDGVVALDRGASGGIREITVYGQHEINGIIMDKATASDKTLTIPDGSVLTVPTGKGFIIAYLAGLTIAPGGKLVNNGFIAFTHGHTVEGILALGLTGSGVVAILTEDAEGFTEIYTHDGTPLRLLDRPMNFAQEADAGNWKADATLETDGYTWNSETSTLTLDDLRLVLLPLSEEPSDDTALALPAGAKLVLTPGSRSMVSNQSGLYAIRCAGTLHISGTGTLEVSARKGGLRFGSGSIEDCSIRATGGSAGISAGSDLDIKNATLTVEGHSDNNAVGIAAVGIAAVGKLRVEGSTVQAKGGTSGLSAERGMELIGGSIRAEGGNAALRVVYAASEQPTEPLLTLGGGLVIQTPVGGKISTGEYGPLVVSSIIPATETELEIGPMGPTNASQLVVLGVPAASGGGSTVTPPKTETVTNPDGSVTKTETTGAKVETKTETTTQKDGAVTKTETTTITGGAGGISGKMQTQTDADGKSATTATVTAKEGATQLQLPAAVTAAAGKSDQVQVLLEVGGVSLTLDGPALAALQKAGGQSPTITVTPVSADQLPEHLRGQGVAFSFAVNGQGADFAGGSVVVTVPYAKQDASKSIAVFFVGADGAATRIPGVAYEGGAVSFSQPHWSVYAIVEEAPLPFTDVAEGAWYYDAVRYAVDQGITSGTGATTFSPGALCTRAQVVTFLWNAMGKPAPTVAANPFTDVSQDSYYHDAVLWAAERGITGGTTATTFSSNAVVTRGQFVTFLHRAAGKPASTVENPFADVTDTGAYYYDAVVWAYGAKVTRGTTATAFSPLNPCTRAQVVTFLFNHFSQ